jgi:hypothetical protein
MLFRLHSSIKAIEAVRNAEVFAFFPSQPAIAMCDKSEQTAEKQSPSSSSCATRDCAIINS